MKVRKNRLENIELTVDPQHTAGEREGPQVFLLNLVYLLAGVFGLLAVMDSVRGISVSMPAYLYAAALCALLCVCFWRSKKLFVGVYLASIALIGFLTYRWSETLLEQFAYFMRCLFAENPEQTLAFDNGAIVSGLVVAFIMFTLECLLKMHGPLYVITTAILAVSPFLAVQIDAISLLPLIVFQVSFWALHNVRKYGGGRDVVLPKGSGVARKGSLLTVLALILCFFIVSPVLLPYAPALYAVANEVEGFASRTFQNVSEENDGPFLDGQVSRGNNYRTGAEKLSIEVSQLPTETLYLRGFSGGDYVGGSWKPANDEQLFGDMEEILNWGRWSSSIAPMYRNMTFFMNQHQQGLSRPRVVNLVIRHSDGNYDRTYSPYYGVELGGWNYERNRNKPRESGWRYTYGFYWQDDVNVEWENVDPEFTMVRDWYMHLEDAYRRVSHGPYTQVPINRIPRLAALVAENPLEDLDEITAFILYVLQNGAEYDLAPGWAPVNEDIAEYFLFERKSGYCVHFATAATLMYRLYGIPARYATGYAVPPSLFELEEYDTHDITSSTYIPMTWTARVTDEYAHAWVEIYLDRYGWTPVEVTPSIGGTMSTSYPGFDPSIFSGILQNENWNAKSIFKEDEKQSTSRSVARDESAFFRKISPAASSSDDANDGFAVLMCITAVICLLPLLLECLRLRSICRLDGLECRRLFGRLMELLRFCGKLTDQDGNEPDFPLQLASSVPGLSLKAAQELTTQVQYAAYGPKDVSGGSSKRMVEAYKLAAKTLPENLSGFKRWIGKYIKRLF